MEWLTDPQAWVAFVTFTALEIVLGIDNVIFISILAGKLPKGQQGKARQLGLGWRWSPGSGCCSPCPGWCVDCPFFTVFG